MRFIGFIVGVMLTLIGFWLYGYDFDQRGDLAVSVFFCSLLIGAYFGWLGSYFKD